MQQSANHQTRLLPADQINVAVDSHFGADVLHAISDVVPRLAQVLLNECRSDQFEDFDGIVH